MCWQRVECNRRASELRSQLLCAFDASIRDDHASQTVRVKMARCQCNRLAGTDEQRRVILEFLENRAGQGNGSGGD